MWPHDVCNILSKVVVVAAAISLTSPETLEAWGVSEAGLASGAVTADSKAVFFWIAEWEGISELEEKIGSHWAQIYSSEKHVDKIVVAHTWGTALGVETGGAWIWGQSRSVSATFARPFSRAYKEKSEGRKEESQQANKWTTLREILLMWAFRGKEARSWGFPRGRELWTGSEISEPDR